jgi:predicted nucleic acid-binding protein
MLDKQLDAAEVLGHPHVTGELALGTLRHRGLVLAALQDLPKAVVATEREVLQFVEANSLSGLGIGWVDAHLLAAARLSHALLWTRDKRARAAAERLALAPQFP